MTKDDNRIAADYLRRLGWSLQGIDAADRAAILGEIRSHLADSAAQGPDGLARALSGLGSPYTLARGFIEEYELAGAAARAAPGRLLLAVLGRATRSAGAMGAAFAGLLLYVLAFGFAAMALLKPVLPDHVGAWLGPDGLQAGLVATPPAATDLLGGWIVPVAVALAIGCYVAATRLLRGFAGRTLAQTRSAALAG